MPSAHLFLMYSTMRSKSCLRLEYSSGLTMSPILLSQHFLNLWPEPQKHGRFLGHFLNGFEIWHRLAIGFLCNVHLRTWCADNLKSREVDVYKSINGKFG